MNLKMYFYFTRQKNTFGKKMILLFNAKTTELDLIIVNNLPKTLSKEEEEVALLTKDLGELDAGKEVSDE